ncbi:PREDICTED: shugoshin-like 2 isoform X4 [Myotis brandtii]|uniref:shugoshin-like 2 isoform X4 n=1 Tax=Myotis brandtii TaxID=109478 RepID=UPI000703DC3C|nr:PREDICTED: shugoshin-like 2 isoform X4 [Myotis brandtii]
MDYQVTEMGSLFPSGIKRHVKDKRMSKTAKLNVSLASKIKTKIINNSSIFKISLKHNNRALAQALSREKENSRRMATEKMLLQKEVEKLNFENTFLRLKLNNLNKKLIEIEAHLNNSLITAIEMSNFSEFHQSPFLLPASKNKRVSKQCMSMRLPFARVPLTSNDDDDDEDKEKMQHDNNFLSKTSSDVPTLVSTRQSLSPQYNLELCLKENNQNVCLDDSEQISSIIDILPKENYSHYEQSSKSSLMSEMKNSQPISHKQEIPSFNNITKRKKLASFLESNNPCPDNPCMTDLNQEGILSPELNGNNNINDHTNERNIKMQRNIQCLPDSSESASEPAPECMNQVQGNDDFQEQKTVYDTDMDLTASEVVSQIVTVSKGTKNKRNNKPNDCATKTFRKVKDSSSEKKRERSKRQIKNSSEMNVEEKIENEPEKRPVGLNDSGDSEDPNSIFSTEQLTQLNKLKTITLHNDFDQDDRQSTENGKKKKKKKKRIHVTNEQEETYSFSQNSDKFQQESKLDMDMTSLAYDKNKASRQTFVIHKLEKGHLFLNQKDQETISENLEITNEFQTADLATKHNGNLCDYETQNTLDLKKHVTDAQSAQQHESKVIKKLRQKVNRKTEIISEAYQIYRDNDKDVHGQESYTKDLDFKVHESKQRLECQGIISGYCMEINSNEKENCEQISNPYKQKKHGKESSGKTKNILAKNKSIFQLTDSSQTPVSLESDLKQVANEADSDSSNQMGAHKNPKQSTTTFNKKSDIPFAEVMKGECQIKRRSKMTSKSKKRKTLIDPSPYSHEVMHIISDTSQRMPVGSEQADEQNLENEKTKPDFYTKMFNSLSQIYSPNIQDSSHNGVHEGSRALRSSSSKNLMIKKNVALESSPVCAVSDDVQEEMAGMTFQVTQRTQRSGAGGRTLQDLTNTNFVSNNTATSENKSEDLILELPKRRRCTPLNLKEPSLKDKMRR